jgi:hypothetical protein
VDLKPVIDAGVLGLLVYLIFIISSKVDKMIDAHQKLLGQLIEIIGREDVARAEMSRQESDWRYDHDSNPPPPP